MASTDDESGFSFYSRIYRVFAAVKRQNKIPFSTSRRRSSRGARNPVIATLFLTASVEFPVPIASASTYAAIFGCTDGHT